MKDYFEQFFADQTQINDPEKEPLSVLDRGCPDQPDRFLSNLQQILPINNYPDLGIIPPIESLDFLDPMVTEACICVLDSGNNAHWYGRNMHDRGQFWSATKFLTLVYLFTQVDSSKPMEWLITDTDRVYFVSEMIAKVFNYSDQEMTSNALAAMFKCFFPQITIEQWLQDLTGNKNSIFRGGYGEPPFISQPLLTDRDGMVLLQGNYIPKGENLVSAYDLTRVMTQFGWCKGLPDGLTYNFDRYELLLRAMTQDTARYIDVALETLDLNLSEVVILSKMGFGRSETRNRSELIYTALFSAKELNFCLTYKTAFGCDRPGLEAMTLDARMCAEITKTIGWLLL